MKVRIIKVKIVFSIIISIAFVILTYMLCSEQVDDINTKTYETVKRISTYENTTNSIKKNVEKNEKINLPEYVDLPREYKGYEVIGKILIPKLKIEKYILGTTTDEALKVAVTKTCGPDVNEIGNLCISGHNYVQTFGRIKELEIGDEIILIDKFSRKRTYIVYKNYKVLPNDVECLSQNTEDEREVTLITCTLGAIKRNIIKAIEKYD